MGTTSQVSGACLCGKVTVTVAAVRDEMGVCHCNMCRAWASGPYFASLCESPPVFNGEEHIGIYASSAWAERGFCKHCGSSLFYRMKQGEIYMLSVGLLKQQDAMQMTRQVFIDEKPAHYAFANNTPTMTGAEIAAKRGR